MFTTAGRRGDICDHGCLTVANEGVFKDLSKLAASEGRMILLLIQCSNALLQRQERLVNLSAVQSCLPVLVNCICSALTSSQINEAHLAEVAIRFSLRAKLELEDGV